MTPLTFACSPCPNDTFLFGAIATGAVALAGAQCCLHLHDIETLNGYAMVERYDVTKVSAHAALLLEEPYQALGVGTVMGVGCGPLLLHRRHHPPADWRQGVVVFPGALTTAYLLFRLRFPESDPQNHRFAPYHKIPQIIMAGGCDGGVVIHESRFTYQDHALAAALDLGEWWTSHTGLPIPLGVCLLRRSLFAAWSHPIEELLRQSLQLARVGATPEMDRFMVEHALEKSPAILAQHVATFINQHTDALDEIGHQALARLAAMAKERGIVHGC